MYTSRKSILGHAHVVRAENCNINDGCSASIRCRTGELRPFFQRNCRKLLKILFFDSFQDFAAAAPQQAYEWRRKMTETRFLPRGNAFGH